MPKLVWDDAGKKRYETGLDRGVLYLPDGTGVPWNGLLSVEEDNSDITVESFYFDAIKYLQVRSLGDVAGTLTAYTYPAEFERFDGIAELENSLLLGNQPVDELFSLSYRTRIGNDVDGTDHGYKIHVLYNLTATPSNRSYQTISDQPNAMDLAWDINAVPEPIPGAAPTAHLIFDTTKMNRFLITDLENLLYGRDPVYIPPSDDELDGGTPETAGVGELDGGTFTWGGQVAAMIEDPTDPGIFLIQQGSLVEDQTDPGIYLIHNGSLIEDATDPGVYLIEQVAFGGLVESPVDGTLEGGTAFSGSGTVTEGDVVVTPAAKLPPMSDLVELIRSWLVMPITDNGDGTWSVTLPDEFVTFVDPTEFKITSASATYLDADTYELTDTHYL